MFSAYTTEGHWISLVDLSYDQVSKLKKHGYHCPDCEQPLLLKRGDHKATHFSHHTTSCKASSLSPKESLDHMNGKWLLYHTFSSYFTNLSVEHYFPKVQQRADFCMHAPYKIVYEFQCSQLKPSEIIERTAGYSTLGYSCRWLVHESFLPLNSGRIIITKLSLFLEMCIFTHHNGKRTLTFLNPTLKKLTIFIIHYALAGHYYLVEIHRLVVNHPSQLLSQPKVTCLEEAEVIQAFNHHHLKQRRYLFQYYRPEDRIFHMLVKKWRKSEITLPYYIGLPSLSPHTLGNDFIWQFKLVNYHLTHYSALSSLSVEEIISNFLFSFPNANLDTAENWLAIRNYQQFLQLNRLPNRPFHLIKNTTPYIEKWYRFHILAKPSKD